MNYPYESKIYLAEAVLNVKNLEQQTAFYHRILGLEILEQESDQVLLGAGKKPLVRLRATAETDRVQDSYGLYHMAILLPTREALGDIFKHIAELKIPLVGGADHGYSEALYLEDLEGNGIELYRDKPVVEWDIREDGRIVGVTEELAAQDIYELGRELDPFVIAPDTRMGHIHLSVKDSKAASQFYQQVLGLDDKFSMPTGSWLASGNYHHHLAVNEWAGPHLAKRRANLPGLSYYVVEVAEKSDLLAIHEKAQIAGTETKWLSSSQLEVTDPDGIVTMVRVALDKS